MSLVNVPDTICVKLTISMLFGKAKVVSKGNLSINWKSIGQSWIRNVFDQFGHLMVKERNGSVRLSLKKCKFFVVSIIILLIPSIYELGGPENELLL
jgi:hypothetical protein